MTEDRFAFDGAERNPHRWIVSCDGVARARLDFFESVGEWRLYGMGPLAGCLYGWGHNGMHFRNPPAHVRREAIELLAAWALAALPVEEAA